MSETASQITYKGRPLDTTAESFAELRSSNDILSDTNRLRERMADEGYLFLPGFLDIDQVRTVREEIFMRLGNEGVLHTDYPRYEGICNPDAEKSSTSSIDYRTDGTTASVLDCRPLRELLYQGRLVNFFENFFEGPVLCFNHVWFRTKGANSKGSPPVR